MQIDVYEYVVSLREHFASYHNHKEQMAFGATGLYIAGITALLAQDIPKWVSSWKEGLLAVLGIAALVSFLFVRWQLGMREYAKNMVDACNSLIAKWLADSSKNIRLNTTTFRGRILPEFLAEELEGISGNEKQYRSAALPRYLTYATMLLWSLLLAVRILS